MSEIGLVGKKIGMTREFYKTGQSVPVTVLKVERGRIIQLIAKEKRGYDAIQLGFGNIKNSKLSKSMKGYFSKKNTEAKKTLKEIDKSEAEKILKEENERNIKAQSSADVTEKKLKTSEKKPKKASIKKKAKKVSKK